MLFFIRLDGSFVQIHYSYQLSNQILCVYYIYTQEFIIPQNMQLLETNPSFFFRFYFNVQNL